MIYLLIRIKNFASYFSVKGFMIFQKFGTRIVLEAVLRGGRANHTYRFYPVCS